MPSDLLHIPRLDADNGKPAPADVVPAPQIKFLQINNVSLGVVLKQICGAINYRYTVDDGVITLEPSC